MTTITHRDAETIVRSATFAPSILNTQPWRFEAGPDDIELILDSTRRLPVIDPRDRARVISCGAALLNARLAMAGQGSRPDVQLVPDTGRPDLLARLRRGETVVPDADECRLADMITRRRTSRVPFRDQPPTDSVASLLGDTARTEGAVLRWLNSDETDEVLELVAVADRAQRIDLRVREELARWTRRGTGATDGLPDFTLGPTPSSSDRPVRDFAIGADVTGRGRAEYEAHPTLAMLLTPTDTPVDWLRAGQALQRVWLEATSAGLAVSLLTQPMELSNLRWLTRPHPVGTTQSEPHWPQALLRVGYATSATPHTPRRPVADVLTFVA